MFDLTFENCQKIYTVILYTGGKYFTLKMP